MKAAPRGIQVNIIHHHSLLNFAYKTQLPIGRGWEGDVDKKKNRLERDISSSKRTNKLYKLNSGIYFFPLSYFRDTV